MVAMLHWAIFPGNDGLGRPQGYRNEFTLIYIILASLTLTPETQKRTLNKTQLPFSYLEFTIAKVVSFLGLTGPPFTS